MRGRFWALLIPRLPYPQFSFMEVSSLNHAQLGYSSLLSPMSIHQPPTTLRPPIPSSLSPPSPSTPFLSPILIIESFFPQSYSIGLLLSASLPIYTSPPPPLSPPDSFLPFPPPLSRPPYPTFSFMEVFPPQSYSIGLLFFAFLHIYAYPPASSPSPPIPSSLSPFPFPALLIP